MMTLFSKKLPWFKLVVYKTRSKFQSSNKTRVPIYGCPNDTLCVPLNDTLAPYANFTSGFNSTAAAFGTTMIEVSSPRILKASFFFTSSKRPVCFPSHSLFVSLIRWVSANQGRTSTCRAMTSTVYLSIGLLNMRS